MASFPCCIHNGWSIIFFKSFNIITTVVFIATFHFNEFLTWKQGYFIHCSCWGIVAVGGED